MKFPMRPCLLAWAVALFAIPAMAEPEWGAANERGLKTRLVPLDEIRKVGKPLLFRLEGQNTGKTTIYADIQSLAHAEKTLEVTTGKAAKVAVISASLSGCSTSQDYLRFPPGKVVVIAGRIDAAEDYELIRAGAYRFRHPGLPGKLPVIKKGSTTNDSTGLPLNHETVFTTLPPSNTVTLELGAGTLPPDLAMISKLRSVLPPGWFVCRRWEGTGVQVGKDRPNGWVSIHLTAVDPKGKVAMEDEHRRLGQSVLGEIRIGAIHNDGKGSVDLLRAGSLEEHWPNAFQVLRKALLIQVPGA